MSDEEHEDGGSFRVRDRRQFNAEGERRPPADEGGEADSAGGAPSTGGASPDPGVRTAPPEAPPEPEAPRKRSLRERIMGRRGEGGEASDDMAPQDHGHSASEEISFTHFILSLTTQALMHLGELPDPFTNERHNEPALAKQTIDLIAMLQEKTRGNLVPDEDRMMAEVLYDLRMRYVKATGGSAS